MSAGRIPWAEASAIAEVMRIDLLGVASRTETVGSVRRMKAEVGDIELLVEPRVDTVGLFAEPVTDIAAIRRVVRTWGTVVKGGDRYIQVLRPDGLKVDVFMCHAPSSWGSLLAIRTGPADLSEFAVTRMLRFGYRHTKGHVEHLDGEGVSTDTEEQFFALAGLPCLAPELRHTPAALRPL